MKKSETEIKNEIKSHIANCGGSYQSWYVGIANDPEVRLFNDHGVNRDTDAWIFRYAINSEISRKIEKYFVEVIGTDGGSGGGDENTTAIYAYKKNSHTQP